MFVIAATEESWRAWEHRQTGYAFSREARRKARRKRRCDCGHVIDGSEPYRYQVWRINGWARGVIAQRDDCEFCARADIPR